MTRVAVMGAGAVGCWIGAMLARAGEAVTLIGRPALVQAVTAQGLRLEMGGRVEVLHPEATTDPAAVAGAGLVLVCVKSGDTEAAGRAMAPHLAPEALVLSLQNGIGNAEALARVTGQSAHPAVVYVAAALAGPGHVLHRGRGELVVGPAARDAAARLQRAGVPVTVSADVLEALWVKLTINCALNALSALTRQPYGAILGEPGAEDLLAGLVGECGAVARGEGVGLPGDMLAQVLALARAMPGQMSSTAQDLIAGKPTEIAALNGEVARRGAALGIAVPLNASMVVMVNLAGRSVGSGVAR